MTDRHISDFSFETEGIIGGTVFFLTSPFLGRCVEFFSNFSQQLFGNEKWQHGRNNTHYDDFSIYIKF